VQLLLYLTAAPVIVFCRSGRRAGKAKETLEQLGYTKVLNAGGLEDLMSKLE
jgi:phage shock protein E